MKQTTHLHLAPRPRISGAIPLLPPTPSWRGQTKLYLPASCTAFRLKLYQACYLVGLTDCHSLNVTLSCRDRSRLLLKRGLYKNSRDRKCSLYGDVFGGGRRRVTGNRDVLLCVCADPPTNILLCLNSSPVNQCPCLFITEQNFCISSEVIQVMSFSAQISAL